MNTDINTITINGVKYIQADQVPAAKPNGNRAVVVLDRGWIYAGDITEENGRVTLSRALWLFRWQDIGLNGVLADPHNKKVDLRPVPGGLDYPIHAELFRLPVDENWGL